MKTMKKLHVALAAASVCAVVGNAGAASVSQSGLTIAREVISANSTVTQTLRAPTVSFNFDNGPTANGKSTQDFNLTLTLAGDGNAIWDSQLATYKTVSAVRRNNGNAVVPVLPASAGATTFDDATKIANDKVALVLLGVDRVAGTSNKTYRFKFRLLNNKASSFGIGDLQLTFNGQNPGNGTGDFDMTGVADATTALTAAATVAATDYGLVTQLASAANATTVTSGAGKTGDTDSTCGENPRRVTVTVRNYIGSGDGVEGESANSAATITNNGYIQFVTALRAEIGKGVAIDRNTQPTSGNQTLTTTGLGTDVTATTMALGFVKFSNRSVDAWDTSQQTAYYKLAANDLNGTANEDNGNVDVGGLVLDLTASNGFAEDVEIGLSNSPVCDPAATVFVTPTLSTVDGVARKRALASFTRANLANAFAFGTGSITNVNTGFTPNAINGTPFGTSAVAVTDRAQICMKVGTKLIPQSKMSGTVELTKDHGNLEQSNLSCSANLAGLGGGVKIDVRNYMEFLDNSDWRSYVRVINNSETVTADVFAQYIRADGTYGKWVKLGDLPARAARFWSDQEIRNLMAASGAVSSANADTVNQNYNNGLTGAYLAGNARLRISSEAASTLRVQNYLYNAKTQLLSELSASQGADFVNVEASTRDHIDQDAQTGIKK